MSRKARKSTKKKPEEITKDTIQPFLKRKSQQLRANHLARLKKLDPECYKSRMAEVPKPEQFYKWLDKNLYLSEEGVPYFVCEYSKERFKPGSLEIDHKIPPSQGGSFGLRNLAIASGFSNKSKGDLNAIQYRQLLKLLDKWDTRAKFSVLKRLIQASGIYRGFRRKGG